MHRPLHRDIALMPHSRRHARLASLAVTLLVSLTGVAGAQTPSASSGAFPDRAVRLILSFAPGGFADITARLLAERMAPLLGQQMVVENLPGAGGAAAAQAALRGKPDGHTLLLLVNGHATTKAAFKNPPFDPVKDFAAVGLLSFFDLIVVTRSDGPHPTLSALIANAKERPGRLNIGTVNPGSTQNLAAELIKATTSIDVSIVPYKGTPDLAVAVLGGQLDALVDTYTALKSQIDSGRLRAVVSSGSRRSAYLPNVPTMQESGFQGFDVIGWNGLAVPPGTPAAVIATLNRHLNTVIGAAEFRKRLLELGAEPAGGTAEEMARRVANDVARWEAVAAKAGLEKL